VRNRSDTNPATHSLNTPSLRQWTIEEPLVQLGDLVVHRETPWQVGHRGRKPMSEHIYYENTTKIDDLIHIMNENGGSYWASIYVGQADYRIIKSDMNQDTIFQALISEPDLRRWAESLHEWQDAVYFVVGIHEVRESLAAAKSALRIKFQWPERQGVFADKWKDTRNYWIKAQVMEFVPIAVEYRRIVLPSQLFRPRTPNLAKGKLGSSEWVILYCGWDLFGLRMYLICIIAGSKTRGSRKQPTMCRDPNTDPIVKIDRS